MKKIILFLADGFEEVEAFTTVDYLRRMDLKVSTVSISEDLKVKGAHDIVVLADKTISEIDSVEDYHAVVIPGGLPGATNLRDSKRVIELVQEMDRSKKLLAAICAGPIVFEKADVIKGKALTSYPGFEDQLGSGAYKEDSVVKDGNMITSRGPALAVNFAIEIVDYLLGKEKAEELKEDILYK